MVKISCYKILLGKILHIFDLECYFMQIYLKLSPMDFIELTHICVHWITACNIKSFIFKIKDAKEKQFVLHFGGHALIW